QLGTRDSLPTRLSSDVEVERALGVVLEELPGLPVLEEPLALEVVRVVHEVDLEPDAGDRGDLHLEGLGLVPDGDLAAGEADDFVDRKSTRLDASHVKIS